LVLVVVLNCDRGYVVKRKTVDDAIEIVVVILFAETSKSFILHTSI